MARNEEPIDTGTMRFRPRARLLYLLGHELITDEALAVAELVKNSYDADATVVHVHLLDVTNKKKGRVEIRDDGHGMTLDVVRRAWMEPARDNKGDEKGKRPRTKRYGRLPLGEKGVGRFSVDKLGLRLELISRACEFDEKTKKPIHLSDKEVQLIVDGSKFTEDSYLDEIECEWVTREPREFKDNGHGTLLRISHFRTPWSEELIEKVRLGLARLSSPFSEAKDLEVSFSSNEFPELSAKIENPLLDIAPWVLDADIDEFGLMQFSVKGPKITREGETDLRKGHRRFLAGNGKSGEYRTPTCGPFKLKLYAFEKDRRKWKKFGMDKARIHLLNDLSGVSVYRDGFRILPYGEVGNDWLSFDRRRVQNPGMILGNDRVIGYIEISRVSNPYLIDKTNREGLIEEGNAYQDFKELSVRASDFLGLFRWNTLPRKKRSKAKAEEGKQEIEDGTKIVEEISNNLRILLNSADKEMEGGNLDAAFGILLEGVKDILEGQKATEQIKEGTVKLLEELRESNEQVDNLIALSGIGMTAERMTHELSKAAGNAKKLLKDSVKLVESGKADATTIKKNVLRVIGQLDIIIDHIHQMEPLYYSRRRHTEELDVAEIAGDMEKFYSNTIRDLGIDVDISAEGKLRVEMNRGHLLQVFNNLFDNSFYWLECEPPKGQPRIAIKVSGVNEKTLVFADNGPGIESYVEDHVFDPFVSTKPGGRGLGLYIVQDILRNYKADVELVTENRILDGANFRITFSEG